MSIESKIETVGSQFIVVDPWDEIVGRYTSEEEAQQNIKHFKVENAVKARMQLNGVDRDTAERAIRDVTGGA
jgi:hypothetical protein